MLVTLTVALLGYAALAADVVHGGAASRRDVHIAKWTAQSMPAWAEWVARPFTWLGGVVGVTVVVVAASYALLRRGRIGGAVLSRYDRRHGGHRRQQARRRAAYGARDPARLGP
jgi:hypothetical protein